MCAKSPSNRPRTQLARTVSSHAQGTALFQSKLLEQIFSQLEAGRAGRHDGDIIGEGAVETQRTQPYEFGDSLANLDLTSSLTNALIRDPVSRPIRFQSRDLVVHQHANHPMCATMVLMDMSGSMRYGGMYINVKRMALHRRADPPRLPLAIFCSSSRWRPCQAQDFGRSRHTHAQTVTIYDPIVRLRADLSDPEISESQIPPHFTNIQTCVAHFAAVSSATTATPNKQGDLDHGWFADSAL